MIRMMNQKISKYMRGWSSMLSTRWRLLLTLLVSIALLIVIYQIEVRSFESHDFRTPRDAIWRAIVTSTTIGYGDMVPKTFWGQFLSVFYIICTILLLSEAIRSLSSAIYSSQLNAMKGLSKTTFTNHTVIYGGFQQQMTTIIEQLYEEHTSMNFVVMSPAETIPSAILGLKQDGIPIHFVHGTPLDSDSLDRARIDKAASCILLHEPRNDSDMYLISYVMNIRSQSPQVKLIVEMMQEANRNIFESAGCDSIINTDTITKNLLVRSVTDDVHHIMRELLTFGAGYELYRVGLAQKRVGMTFGDLIHAYVDHQLHVVGIYHDGHVFFDGEHELTAETLVYVISRERLREI